MLTPGMNHHGLGPGVREYTFGHGGADEGFRANLVAWKKEPMAVVIMVNSDNGKIIQEIMLSIAQEYGLPGIEPLKRSVSEQPEAVRKTFTGTYRFPKLGEANIMVKGKGLEVSASFLDKPIFLLPETDSTYFDKSDGELFTFVFEGKSVTGMKVQNLEAAKID